MIIFLALLFAVVAQASVPSLQWTMLGVNSTTLQADAHLLHFPDGQYEMVDAGDPTGVLPSILRQKGITRLKRVFISHGHKDHYGGLLAIVRAGVKVDEVYFAVPNKRVCDAEVPWGCDYKDIQQTIDALKKSGVKVLTPRRGQTFYHRGAQLQILYSYDGTNSPIGRTEINDTSTVLLLTYKKTRCLFTGDLNKSLGAYLAQHGSNLRADILKVPHHGTEGVAPNVFFARVNPRLALVPSPRGLWLSERSRRIREYFQSKNIPVVVSGIVGETTVTIDDKGFKLIPSEVNEAKSSRRWDSG